MSSILTNTSAMNALSTLRNVNNNLSETQSRISTGMKVNSAKDNASYFSISTTMKSEIGMNKAINEGMALAKSSISTARLGAETVQDLAKQFVDRAAFAQETGVDLAMVEKELTALSEQMTTAIEKSTFNGENLLSGTASKVVTTGASRDSAGAISTTTQSFTEHDLATVATTFGTIATAIGAAGDQATLESELAKAGVELKSVIAAATEFGIAEKSIETQQNFLNELTDRLDSGVGAMIDADMEQEAARLQSLQVQQQLATQSLSIANQAPQNILSLFR